MNGKIHLHKDMADLARVLHSFGDDGPATEKAVLDEVTAWATSYLPFVDHAGISLLHRHNRTRSFESSAPTGTIPEFIDRLHTEFDCGPYLDAVREQSTVSVHDYAAESRWPDLSCMVVEHTPIRSSLSTQLYIGRQQIGALNLYSESARAFDDDAVEQSEALAAHVAVGISRFRSDQQFKSALASRDVIGQAKGLIMERFGMNADQAFRLLSKLSQDENLPAAELATRFIESDRHRQPH